MELTKIDNSGIKNETIFKSATYFLVRDIPANKGELALVNNSLIIADQQPVGRKVSWVMYV